MKPIHALLSILLAVQALAQAPAPTGAGPEPAIAYSDPGLPTHTIYRPQTLSGVYPVVLWGNGSCVNDNFGYREFLSEIASYGFIVLAIGPTGMRPAPRQQKTGRPGRVATLRNNFRQHFTALDWIAGEGSGGQCTGRSRGHEQRRRDGALLRWPAGGESVSRSAHHHDAGAQQRHVSRYRPVHDPPRGESARNCNNCTLPSRISSAGKLISPT